MTLQVIANGLVSGCVYALIALGFGIIYKTTRVFHFAHGAIYTASAYAFYLFLIPLSLSPLLSIIFALIIGVLLGVGIESFLYYPLYKKRAPFAISFIASMGIYLFLINLIAMLFGNEVKILQPGLEKTYQSFGVIFTRTQIVEVLVFLIVFSLFYVFMKKSGLGRLIRALSNNPELATVLGINVKKTRLLVFGLGSLLASISGLLVALDIGVDPNIGFQAVFVSVIAVIIGGVDVFEGAVLGAFLLGLIQNITVWKLSARWQEAITFGILILFLLLRPQGLLSYKKRMEEITQ